jgi:glycosyltransferase involved in cell wall biosynthesis
MLKNDNGNSLISIICPVFNEQDAIPIFYRRLAAAIEPLLDRYVFEILFTNNCSIDESLTVIRGLRLSDPRVQVITLSRNFGYQASVLAGLKNVKGDAIIVIDVDCEDPPELIPAFVEKWEQGFDIVYGRRNNRPEPRPVLFMRKLFYRLLKLLADTDIILDMAEFSLVTRRVLEVMCANHNTFPFLRAEIGYAGYTRIGIDYDRQSRTVGKSNYNLWQMFLFACAGILSVSTFPLRLGAYLWPLMAVLNTAAIIVLTLESGFSSKIFAITILCNMLYCITLLTALGLYIARIYKNIIKRPIYIIDSSRTFTDSTS